MVLSEDSLTDLAKSNIACFVPSSFTSSAIFLMSHFLVFLFYSSILLFNPIIQHIHINHSFIGNHILYFCKTPTVVLNHGKRTSVEVGQGVMTQPDTKKSAIPSKVLVFFFPQLGHSAVTSFFNLGIVSKKDCILLNCPEDKEFRNSSISFFE